MRRGLLALIGRNEPLRPAFDQRTFTRWAIDNGEFHSITSRRASTLLGEFCEYHEIEIPSDAIFQDEVPLDVAAFTNWVRELGYSRDLSIHNMRDLTAWYCLLVGHCTMPSDAYLIRVLRPGGWVEYRGKQRPCGDKIARPTLYRIDRPMELAA